MAFEPEKHIIKVSGKDYLPVAARIAWFRSTHPEGQISTDLVQIEPFPVVKAVIANNDGAIIATAYGSAQLKERSVYAGREIEKAETAAIGRALASAGFGTLFAADDFDDAKDEHLADSPTQRPAPQKTQQKPNSAEAVSFTKDSAGKFLTYWNKAGATNEQILSWLGVERLGLWKKSEKEAGEIIAARLKESDAPMIADSIGDEQIMNVKF